MKRLPIIFVAFFAHLLLILFIADSAPCQETSQSEPAAKAVNAFAIDLYGQLRKQEGNLFFSPYSVSASLAMAYTGAAGKTESQMAKALHFNLEKAKINEGFRTLSEQVLAARGKGAELNIANALWADKSFTLKKEYLDAVKTNFVQDGGWSSRVPLVKQVAGSIWADDPGVLRQVDFRGSPEAAEKTINSWVERQTKNRIRDLLTRGTITPDTRLVITNAIYFKGFWESPFEKELTKQDSFTLLNGMKASVLMMQHTGSFRYAEEADLQVLEMPYKGDELCMRVLLPARDRKFEDFERSLTIEKMGQWIEKLRTRRVVVYLPKFKMTSGFQLRPQLGLLGMPDAFSVKDADFSGMTGNKDLFIQEVIHKAFVDVYEEGTEAAAATGLTMMTGMPPKLPVFRADHPFVFLIRHKPSGCILFMGRVTKPEQQ